MSVVLTGKAPYKKVVTYQYVKDENGNEFHKSGGNTLECDIVADQTGADTIRYLYGGANITNDMRFGFSLTDDARRKLMNYWNAYVFFNTYACIDNPDIKNFTPDYSKLCVTDRWLIEKVNSFIKLANDAYSTHKSYLVVKEFETIIDDLTNFYIRVNRKRFWKSDDKSDQITAYWCLYHTLKALTQCMAPIIPFLTEYIWQNMTRSIEPDEAESVILSDFPDSIANVDFYGILQETEIAREVITIAQRLRNENAIKVKQPLKTMYLIMHEPKDSEAVRKYENIIKDELNIKNIVFENDNSKFNIPYLSINFKLAGAILKGNVQKLKEQLLQCNEQQMADYVKQYNNGKVLFDDLGELPSNIFNLNYKAKTEFVIATSGNITIVLDITIDNDLMLEGLYRELVRDIQILRKEANFNIEDRIDVSINTNSEILNKVLEIYSDKIRQEALILNLDKNMTNPSFEKEVDLNDEKVNIKMNVSK